MKSRSLGWLVGLLLLVGGANAARAAKYMTIEEAVKAYVPESAKVFKVTKTLTPDEKERLKNDYGWEAKDPEYVFYVGKLEGAPAAYVFVVSGQFNTCFHKFAVGLEPNGTVKGTAIVELSCPRSFRVNKKAFLSQFAGKRHSDALTIKADIDAVTGATLSSEAAATSTRKAVSLHNLFFGGAEPVKVSASVAKTRASANAMIEKAIATGETIEKPKKGAKTEDPQ